MVKKRSSPLFAGNTRIRVFNGSHFYIARSSVESLFIISARVSLLSRQLKAFPRVSPKRCESIKFLNFRLCYIVAYAIKVTNVAQYILVTLFAFNNRRRLIINRREICTKHSQIIYRASKTAFEFQHTPCYSYPVFKQKFRFNRQHFSLL